MKPRERYYYNIHFLPAEGKDVGKVDIDRYQDVLGPIREEWTMDLARRIVRKHQHDEENET